MWTSILKRPYLQIIKDIYYTRVSIEHEINFFYSKYKGQCGEDGVNWLKCKRTKFISSDYSKKFIKCKIYIAFLVDLWRINYYGNCPSSVKKLETGQNIQNNHFSDVGQLQWKPTISERKTMCESYHCQSLLLEGNFQAAMQGKKTQREPNNLAKFMRQILEFREAEAVRIWIAKYKRRRCTERKFWVSAEEFPGIFCRIMICTCGVKLGEVRKRNHTKQ